MLSTLWRALMLTLGEALTETGFEGETGAVLGMQAFGNAVIKMIGMRWSRLSEQKQVFPVIRLGVIIVLASPDTSAGTTVEQGTSMFERPIARSYLIQCALSQSSSKAAL